MKSHTWVVDCKEMEKAYIKGLKAWDRYYLLRDIDRRKYFEGFNVGKEKAMFQEELKDLELVYKRTLVEIHEKVTDCLPALIHYMDEFVTLHKQNEAVREKLDGLLAKTGREPQEENNGGDDE